MRGHFLFLVKLENVGIKLIGIVYYVVSITNTGCFIASVVLFKWIPGGQVSMLTLLDVVHIQEIEDEKPLLSEEIDEEDKELLTTPSLERAKATFETLVQEDIVN